MCIRILKRINPLFSFIQLFTFINLKLFTMKKLIKFLFPKTYQAIFSEGYNECWDIYNQDYNHDDYESYYDYDYEEQYEQNELQRLHDEHYAELAKEFEEQQRQEEQILAELYIPKTPQLEIGDRIHLHSKQGMYTVTEVYDYSFAYCTKHSDISYADYSDYKCHAGGLWNFKGK